MRGIEAKVRSDAVRLYASQRGIDPGSLSDTERLTIGDQGLEQLRQRFDDRIAREPEITRLREVNAELYGALIETGMTDAGEHNPLWRPGGNDDPEFFLGRLAGMVEQIQRDTGRTRLMTNAEYEYRRVLAAHGLIDGHADVGELGDPDDPADEVDPELESEQAARQAEVAEWAAQVCPLYEIAAQLLDEGEDGWLFDELIAGEGENRLDSYIEVGERIYELNEQYDLWDYSLCDDADDPPA